MVFLILVSLSQLFHQAAAQTNVDLSKTREFRLDDCEGLTQELCMWKQVCAKDPNEPTKVIPIDCAANYKDPAPPVPPAPPPEPPKPKVVEKTPIEQLYYVDEDSLRDQFLLPEDATKDDFYNAVKDQKKEKEQEARWQKAYAEQEAKNKNRKPVNIDLPEQWKNGKDID